MTLIRGLPIIMGMSVAVAGLPGSPGSDEKAAAVPVHYREGLVHGLLALRTREGKTLADGDLIQTVHGDRVTARLRFRFHDGSLSDETTVYTQRDVFRLESDRVIQRGPAFERPLDLSIDVNAGKVTINDATRGAGAQPETSTMSLPDTLANGVLMVVLKNVGASALPLRLPYLAATPKPRLVTLVVSSAGKEPFSLAGSRRQATHYVLKVDVGGLTGLAARLFGKLPPDSHVWVLETNAPAFVKSEAPLFFGGPVVRTELASPEWSGQDAARSHR